MYSIILIKHFGNPKEKFKSWPPSQMKIKHRVPRKDSLRKAYRVENIFQNFQANVFYEYFFSNDPIFKSKLILTEDKDRKMYH